MADRADRSDPTDSVGESATPQVVSDSTPKAKSASSISLNGTSLTQGPSPADLASKIGTNETAIENISNQTSASIARLNKIAMEKEKPPLPTLKDPSPPPKFDGHTALESFGSVASALAIFGSLMTRAPLTSALNASAAAMKGIREGDETAFKHAQETYKTNMEYVNAVNKIQMDRYTTAFELYKDDINMLSQQIKIISEDGQNKIMNLAAKTKDAATIYGAWNDQKRLMLEAKRYDVELQRMGQQHEEFLTNKKIEEQRLAETNRHNLATEGKQNLQQQLLDKFRIDFAYNHGGKQPTAEQDAAFLQSVKAPPRSAIAMAAQSFSKDFADQHNGKAPTSDDYATFYAKFMSEAAEGRAMGTRAGQLALATSAFEQLAPLAVDISESVDRTQFPTINSLLLAGEKGAGGEAVVQLAGITNTLINTYARTVTPVGQPTEGAQKRAREILEDNWSKGQYAAAVRMMAIEVQAENRAVPAARAKLGAKAEDETTAPKPIYTIGQEIARGGKKYRVTGGDLHDPDVEEIK